MYQLDYTIEKAQSKMKLLQSIPLEGYVNDIVASENGDFAVCAIGQEHKFGRWSKVAGSRNSVAIIKLSINE